MRKLYNNTGTRSRDPWESSVSTDRKTLFWPEPWQGHKAQSEVSVPHRTCVQTRPPVSYAPAQSLWLPAQDGWPSPAPTRAWLRAGRTAGTQTPSSQPGSSPSPPRALAHEEEADERHSYAENSGLCDIHFHPPTQK